MAKNRQHFYVLDGMHRVTYMQEAKGMVQGQVIYKYPADVYRAELPTKTMIRYAVGMCLPLVSRCAQNTFHSEKSRTTFPAVKKKISPQRSCSKKKIEKKPWILGVCFVLKVLQIMFFDVEEGYITQREKSADFSRCGKSPIQQRTTILAFLKNN